MFEPEYKEVMASTDFGLTASNDVDRRRSGMEHEIWVKNTVMDGENSSNAHSDV